MPSRIEHHAVSTSRLPDLEPDAFQCLVHELSSVLGPSSGIDSADVDPMDLQNLMEGYTSKKLEWIRYALGDSSRTYTRNLVDKGNGKSNLVGHASSLAGFGTDEVYVYSLFWSGHLVKAVPFTIMRTHTV